MVKITEIHVYAIDLPVVNGRYVVSGGSVGYGESCPVGPTYQPEHALGARTALQQMCSDW